MTCWIGNVVLHLRVWLFLKSNVSLLKDLNLLLLRTSLPCFAQHPYSTIHSRQGDLWSQFKATEEERWIMGGGSKDSKLCRRRYGVKHSNQNQETHQKNPAENALKALGNICWCWSDCSDLLVHVRVWSFGKVLSDCMQCFGDWHWVGLWGSLRSILWGNLTSCFYLQTEERAVEHYSSTAASSCPGW